MRQTIKEIFEDEII